MKTEDEILDDMYHHLKLSDLKKAVNGSLSKEDRPDKSDAEDIVISVVTDVPISQLQEVYVNVNIYVADILKGTQYVKDTVRTRKLCQIALNTFSGMRCGDHRISLASQKTMKVNGRNEHLINNKILYQYCKE